MFPASVATPTRTEHRPLPPAGRVLQRAPADMGGKAKPKKHTAAELAAKAKAATESVGGGTAGIAERDKKANLKIECLEPGCAGTKLASLTVCKTHWSNKHCTCRRAPDPNTGCCECFPLAKYEVLFEKPKDAVHTHHNQAATNKSDKNASKSVRDKVKAAQAAAAVIDAARNQSKQFTAKAQGPNTL